MKESENIVSEFDIENSESENSDCRKETLK